MLKRTTTPLISVARSSHALFSLSTRVPQSQHQSNEIAEMVRRIKKYKLAQQSLQQDYNAQMVDVCKKMQMMPKDVIAYALGVNPAYIESTGFNQFNWFVVNFNDLPNAKVLKEQLLDADLECTLFRVSENSSYFLKCYQDNLEELYSFIISGESLASPESLQNK